MIGQQYSSNNRAATVNAVVLYPLEADFFFDFCGVYRSVSATHCFYQVQGYNKGTTVVLAVAIAAAAAAAVVVGAVVVAAAVAATTTTVDSAPTSICVVGFVSR